MFFFSWTNWQANREAWLYMLIGAVTLLVITFLRPFTFKRAIRKIVIKMRGTAGTVEMNAIVEPRGVHAAWSDLEMIYYWRGIQEIEVSRHGVTFLRESDGLIHIPTRVFPSEQSLEHFVRLAQGYSQAATG